MTPHQELNMARADPRSYTSVNKLSPEGSQHPVDSLLETVKRLANEVGMMEERLSNSISPATSPSRAMESRPSAPTSPFRSQIEGATDELLQQINRLRDLRERIDL
jgi:hypothetical protein